MKRNLFMPALFPLVLVQSASRLGEQARNILSLNGRGKAMKNEVAVVVGVGDDPDALAKIP